LCKGYCVKPSVENTKWRAISRCHLLEHLEEKRQQALEQCDRLIKDFAKRADCLKEVEVAAFITTKVCVQIDSIGLPWFVLQRG
jgi:hypothetical protein